MVDVILINPPSDCVDDDHLEPQLGLLYIASLLRENGIPVQIYEMTGCRTEEEVKRKIENIPEASIYGFTTYCTNYPYVKRCIDYIRLKTSNAFIVLGGPNPTALPGLTLKDIKCDCVITGEGEDAFLFAAETILNKHDLPKIIKGKGRANIDTYPTPAWDLIDLNSYTRTLEGEKAVSIISSRGCKYKCVHCNSVVMGGSNKVRYRTPGNIIKEVHYLRKKGLKKFRFNDDNFVGNPAITTLLSQLTDLDINYRIFARLEELNRKNCRLLEESGCRHISVGLETLNPDNLKVLGKYKQIGLEEKHLHNIKQYGMTVRVYFMIGLPFDNDETVPKYFEKACKLPFDEYSLYPLIPYPGTRIWNEPEKFDYEIIDKDFTHYVQIGKGGKTCFALQHKNFTVENVREWFKIVTEIMEAVGKKHARESVVAG
jgi:radical SAM superfamily enzyme YgiQ (UPF0313 family)